VLEGWDTMHEAIAAVVPIELYLRMYRVIESSPALLAVHLRRSVDTEDELTRVLAAREGVDAETDPRPRLAVAVFGAVIRVTERRWSVGDDFSVSAMRELTAAYLDQVGPALMGNWREN
jgi:hypothetical protein